MTSSKPLLAILSVLLFPCVEAGAQIDSLYESINATTVTARRQDGIGVISRNTFVLETERLHTMPMLLGSSDALGLAHYLPSVSAKSELDAGLYIQGNDQGHNLVSAGGVPLYGVTHLLGLFSVFNPSHYTKMRFRTQAPEVNRLGGSVDMELPGTVPDKVGGEFSAGLLSAQGTVSIPLGKKGALTASVRRSYINLLYGSFLKIEGNPLRYGFTDANVTGLWVPGKNDRLWLDAYWGNDALKGDSPIYDVNADWKWGNAMLALHWEHDCRSGARLHQKLFVSAYRTTLDALWTDMHAVLPSSMVTGGYRADWTLGPWSAALESAVHRTHPQNPQVEGGYTLNFQPQPAQTGWENTLLGRYSLPLGPLVFDLGLKGSLYLSPEGTLYAGLDPDLVMKLDFHRAGRIEARVGMQHQYLFQTGMTDLGFPLDFWFLAGSLSAPQKSLEESLAYQWDFGGGMFSLRAEVYYRHLWNQVEYKGNLLDIINGSYTLESAILKGRGRAFGATLSLHKTAGALSGWISYAWGRSLRSFDNPAYPGEYPSSHERIHEWDAVVSWELGRWSLGGTLVAASGTPYTAPEQLYLMGQQLVVQYGTHNGRRMAPYCRLDLSASFFFHKGPRQENGINLSVYNVLGRDNELYYRLYYTKDEKGERFHYGPVHIALRFLPSIAYFHRF